ncbi:hypothetical protein EG329_007995 [Mollisiaceae sp. DMI_Dod_QoI]|nr:hypothetical protein EG329_007995 [Helotiales sp. DMI_Dod_QoI]
MEQGARRRKRTDSSSDEFSNQAKHAKVDEDEDASEIEIEVSSDSDEENGHDAESSMENISSASPGETPLCGFCRAIFEQWEEFLRDEEFEVPHYGYLSDLEASADNGCSLCGQFADAVIAQIDRDESSFEIIAPDLIAPDSDVEEDLHAGHSSESDTAHGMVGQVRMYIPGKGMGHIENTHRLELVQPSTMDTGLLSMVSVADDDRVDVVSQPSDHSFPSTQDSLSLCKQWLRACNSRSKCNLPSPSFLPTRLVFVRGAPRVQVFHDWKGVEKYATLSHCWGNQRFLTLTEGNLHELQEKIPPEALSKTFLDAIFVCRELGIDYIWIDSLCIIQDDPEDWRKEAALMTKVYGHSYINIAASGAVDGSVGLFFPRQTPWRYSIASMPLSGRGWALQERLLPHRTILFTATQAFWECYESVACEIFPKTYPMVLYGDNDAPNRGVFRKEPTHKMPWEHIVTDYAHCSLTFTRDKLVAISGLAREIQQHTKDQYCAGLWGKNIATHLYWLVSYDIIPSNSSPELNDTAPTWSWASVNAPIMMNPIDKLTDSHIVRYVELLDIYTQPNEDPFGPISIG